MNDQPSTEITQSLIDTNTQAAQAWMKDIDQLAQQGDVNAQAIQAMTKTEEGQRSIWAFVATINAALASCAYELPFDDAQSRQGLLTLVDENPALRWAIDQHRVDFPLNELNEDLAGEALERANTRLEAWVG